MFRFIAFIILTISALALIACGGGGAKVNPNPNPPAGGGDDVTNTKPDMKAIENRIATSTDYIKDEILVKTPLEGTELDSLARKYGLEVKTKAGNWATLAVPDRNLTGAIEKIAREQTVYDATIINTYTSKTRFPDVGIRDDVTLRKPNFLPTEWTFSEVYRDNIWVDGEGNPFVGLGQKVGWDPVSGQGGLDNGLRGEGAVVAIIDGGTYIDPTSTGGAIENIFVHYELRDPDGLGGLVTERLHSSSAGYNGTTWTLALDDPTAISYIESDGNIYRFEGNMMLGLAAANTSVPINIGGDPPIIVGMAGIAPRAQYMVLKIGTPNLNPDDPDYTFNDAHIAAAIDYAVANGADIIGLGMWADTGGVHNPAIVTAITNARNSNVLVLAPTGQDLAQEGPFWDATNEVWIYGDSVATSQISPAGAPGVLSVGSTGYVTNAMQNMYTFAPRLDVRPNSRAGFTASDADIYATGIGYTLWQFNQATAPDPPDWFPLLTPGSFIGNEMALGYALGAAALGYEGILTNGDPTDIDNQVAILLLQGGIEDTDINRLLNVNYVAQIANNGGYDLVYRALEIFATLPTSANAVTTNEDFSIEPVINGGEGPYQILIDRGDGTSTPPGGFTPWSSGTIYEKDGGYTEPGVYVLVLRAMDNRGNEASGIATLLVTNPLSAAPVVMEEPGGDPIQPPSPGSPVPLIINTNYVFNAKPFNLLGLGGETYSWDFGDGSAPATEQNPVHKYLGTGNFPVNLTIDDGIRPVFTIQVSVSVS